MITKKLPTSKVKKDLDSLINIVEKSFVSKFGELVFSTMLYYTVRCVMSVDDEETASFVVPMFLSHRSGDTGSSVHHDGGFKVRMMVYRYVRLCCSIKTCIETRMYPAHHDVIRMCSYLKETRRSSWNEAKSENHVLFSYCFIAT